MSITSEVSKAVEQIGGALILLLIWAALFWGSVHADCRIARYVNRAWLFIVSALVTWIALIYAKAYIKIL